MSSRISSIALLLGAMGVAEAAAFLPSPPVRLRCSAGVLRLHSALSQPPAGPRGKDEEEGAVCNAARPRIDPAVSTRLNSVFHERTDGTQWSGPVPGSRGFGRFFRGRQWGEEMEGTSAGGIEPLHPATQALVGGLVLVLKGGLDLLYEDRADFARFYVLETVARVPYFAYISVLHLYESLGRHNRAAWMKVHFAEADNELHHLLIMEALGGSTEFTDRWFAQHSALAYYWACVALYLVHPRAAYHLMSLIEDHAYKTYSKYVECNADWLKTQPAPAIAKQYYGSEDMYLFDSFHTAVPEAQVRRPQITTLYDTFVNIRDDEKQHASTMKSLVDYGHPTPKKSASQQEIFLGRTDK
jgi:ubiquinol oxidase